MTDLRPETLERVKAILEREGEPMDIEGFAARARSMNLPNAAFADCTTSEIVPKVYESLLKSSIAVVTPNDVPSTIGRPPCVASTRSSVGCQSSVYFSSALLTVRFNGCANCAVDEMTQVDPLRARRTCSTPTRVLPRNIVNWTSPSAGACAGAGGDCPAADVERYAAANTAVQ